jgi:radical SAM superfamily enzyme YgiQ (UPF0313 family)
METLIKKGGRQFKFLDRTFNLNIKRAEKIMLFFLEKITAPEHKEHSENFSVEKPPLCVHFEMIPSRLPPAIKELLSRFPPGTLRLELGIQTFNPETAALIHRAGDPGEAIETLEFLRRETNAIIHADLIAGLPGEDPASFGAGFDRLWSALSVRSCGRCRGECRFEIQLGILKCLPGTPISRHNETHRMKYSAAPPYEVIETGAMSASELNRIKNFARFWEMIVNRNSFPELISCLFPPGEPVFNKFMLLSDYLLNSFGKNWGIDRNEMGICLKNFIINQ